MVVVKFQLGKDIRRVAFEENEMNWESLSSSTRSLYGEACPTPFVFKYEDEDGDIITVAGEQELKEALRVFKSCNAVKFIVADPAQKKLRAWKPLNGPTLAALRAAHLGENVPDAPENATPVAVKSPEDMRKMTQEKIEQVRAARAALIAQRFANKEARAVQKAVKMAKNKEKEALKAAKNASKPEQEDPIASDAVPTHVDAQAKQPMSPKLKIGKIGKVELMKAKEQFRQAKKAVKIAKAAEKETMKSAPTAEEAPAALKLEVEPIAPAQPALLEEHMQQLQKMGFIDNENNAKALAASNGDLLSAVRFLLGH